MFYKYINPGDENAMRLRTDNELYFSNPQQWVSTSVGLPACAGSLLDFENQPDKIYSQVTPRHRKPAHNPTPHSCASTPQWQQR